MRIQRRLEILIGIGVFVIAVAGFLVLVKTGKIKIGAETVGTASSVSGTVFDVSNSQPMANIAIVISADKFSVDTTQVGGSCSTLSTKFQDVFAKTKSEVNRSQSMCTKSYQPFADFDANGIINVADASSMIDLAGLLKDDKKCAIQLQKKINPCSNNTKISNQSGQFDFGQQFQSGIKYSILVASLDNSKIYFSSDNYLSLNSGTNTADVYIDTVNLSQSQVVLDGSSANDANTSSVLDPIFNDFGQLSGTTDPNAQVIITFTDGQDKKIVDSGEVGSEFDLNADASGKFSSTRIPVGIYSLVSIDDNGGLRTSNLEIKKNQTATIDLAKVDKQVYDSSGETQ